MFEHIGGRDERTVLQVRTDGSCGHHGGQIVSLALMDEERRVSESQFMLDDLIQQLQKFKAFVDEQRKR